MSSAKEIKINKDTYALAFDNGRVDIRKRDYISDKIVNISVTKDEILALAKELEEEG